MNRPLGANPAHAPEMQHLEHRLLKILAQVDKSRGMPGGPHQGYPAAVAQSALRKIGGYVFDADAVVADARERGLIGGTKFLYLTASGRTALVLRRA